MSARLGSFAAAIFAVMLSLSPAGHAAETGGTTVNPSSSQIASVIGTAHLAEPLVRTSATTPAEDLALEKAVDIYEHRADPEDFSSLAGFVAKHPSSGWTAAVQTNLGLSYLHDGYFARAIGAWRDAWRLGRTATEPKATAMVDRAVGSLAQLYASVGQFDHLEALFGEIGKRPIRGSATEAVQRAREVLMMRDRKPVHVLNCGPIALKLLILALDPQTHIADFLQWYETGAKGTNLKELEGLAGKASFSSRVIARKPGQPVPVPSVAHWKVGHFSMIDAHANGRYHLKDPVFPGGLWMTEAAMDAEGSGYFLIPANAVIAAGWRSVPADEAANVWGKGPTNASEDGAGGARDKDANNDGSCGGGGGGGGAGAGDGSGGDPGSGAGDGSGSGDGSGAGSGNPANCDDRGNGNGDNNCGGMCGYNIRESTVGVTIADTPVGYSPPIGPSVFVSLTYNQREDSQPANMNFFNVSPKWTLNWLTYISDDPTNAGANVSRYLVGGGAYFYSGYDASTGQFSADQDDGSILVRVPGTQVTYRRQLSDGSIEIYAQPDGSLSYPRKIFLSQRLDPKGNAVTLNYDSQQRLTSLTDATGRQTVFRYGQTISPYLITQITDPFGRSATLGYDTSGHLISITDPIGIISKLGYDANSLVNTLTTPYGTTSFSYTAPGSSGPPRFVQVTDPLGNHERLEWLEPAPVPNSDPGETVPQNMPLSPENGWLSYRDSFHWDKNAYVAAGCTPTGGCDYSQAVETHFLHVPNTSTKSTTIESLKNPLENRIWYNYPGQTNSIYEGPFGIPSVRARVLDDGTTQTFRSSYDMTGYFKLTQSIDPIGRTVSLTYGANKIDLVNVSRTTASGVQTLSSYTYNGQHEPLTVTDAAGQVTTYTYNAAGQLQTRTNALNQTTSYSYNPTGDLTSVTDANGKTWASFTYDAFDRVASATDSEGWTVKFSYDSADRRTAVSYPDGTSETYTYDKLDLASYRDRLGRSWTYTHDADRRLTAITDPLGETVTYAYNPAGKLVSQTDPKGNVTQWAYDVEGRTTSKTYADGTSVSYAYENSTSRLKSVTDPLGQAKQFTYAADNDATALHYANAVNPTPDVGFAWDPYFNRQLSRTDGTGTTSFSYVPIGSLGALRVQQETTPLPSGAIAYAYDALGRLASRGIPGSATETFQYDALGRLTGHGDDLGTFALGYLGETRQLASRQLANSNLGTVWSYLSNLGDRRLAQVSTSGLVAGQYSTFQYTTDASGFVTGTAQASDAAAAYPPGTASQAAQYNPLNQLAQLSSQSRTYDANGNLLSDGTHTFKWDAENRLVAIGFPGQPGASTSFSYDGLGRRASYSHMPAGGGCTVASTYLWCGAGLCQERDAANFVVRAYYAEGEFASLGRAYYYAPDRLGSVRRVFATDQTPAYDFDPYGAPLQATAPVTEYGYAGMRYNTESGLYLTATRAYDPATGRFLSRDPIGESGDSLGNLYAYVGGNPVKFVDPAGNGPLGAAIGGTIGGIGGFLGGGIGGATVGTLAAPVVGTVTGGIGGSIAGATEGVVDGAVIGSGIEDLAQSWSKNNNGAWPLDKGGEEWGRRHGEGAAAGRRAAHAAKKDCTGSRAGDDWTMDPDTGDIFDQNGEYQGNASDYLGR